MTAPQSRREPRAPQRVTRKFQGKQAGCRGQNRGSPGGAGKAWQPVSPTTGETTVPQPRTSPSPNTTYFNEVKPSMPTGPRA